MNKQERMCPLSFGLGSRFNETVRIDHICPLGHAIECYLRQYFSEYADAINYITLVKGAYALIDPHNYMRYK